MSAPTDFDALARRRTLAFVEALEKKRAESLQSEMDDLRALVEKRTRDLQNAQTQPTTAPSLEPLVNELCAAARAQTEDQVNAARAAAERTLSETREHAATELRHAQEAERAAQQKLDAVREELHQARGQAAEQAERSQIEIEAAHAANATLAAQAEEARAKLAAERAKLVAQLEESRAALTVAERRTREVAAERDEAARAHQKVAERMSAAESAAAQARTEAQSAVAQARADAQDAVAQARAEAQDAAAQARSEAQAAAAQARADADARVAKARSEAPSAPGAALGSALLDRTAESLRAMQRAVSANEVFDVILDCLSVHFDRAAVLIAGSAGLKVWLHRGFTGDASISGWIVPSATRSPAIRALETQEPVELDDHAASGLVGDSISRALAMPIVARGKTIAVAYAESSAAMSKEAFEVGRKFAEILIETASRRVSATRSSKDDETPDGVYTVQRQARRVKMREDVNITLDGSASFLIDLSTIGAQVISPVPLRPKQDVRIELVVEERSIACAGRVVWALFEQAKGATGALYRAGVQFVEVDTPGVEAFLKAKATSMRRTA